MFLYIINMFTILILFILFLIYCFKCMYYTLPIVQIKYNNKFPKIIKSKFKKESMHYDNNIKFRRFVVQGDELSYMNINHNDIISVRTFDKNFKVSELLTDVPIVIFLNNNSYRGYKIGLFESLSNNNLTIYYFNSDNGKEYKTYRLDPKYEYIVGIVDIDRINK